MSKTTSDSSDESGVQMTGKARELFLDRIHSTFSVSKHGVEAEFHRPVGANLSNLDELDEQDRELVTRLSAASDLLEEQKEQEMNILLNKEGGADLDVEDMIEQAYENVDRQCEVLSAYAVDDDFRDPEVWETIFPTGDKISEIYREFVTEGDGNGIEQRLAQLQQLTAANS